MKIPEAYKTPLKKRQDIQDFIIQNTIQRSYNHEPHPLCINVKCYNVNPEFEHLLELIKNYEDEPYLHHEDWLKQAKIKYDEVEDQLFDWGLEDARRNFEDSDTCLPNGEKIEVNYEFVGRSGGWLSITRFENYSFQDTYGEDGLEQTLKEMDFKTLKKLYQLITMLKHDLKHPEQEVEFQAAFQFVYNACADIPKPDAIQKKLDY